MTAGPHPSLRLLGLPLASDTYAQTAHGIDPVRQSAITGIKTLSQQVADVVMRLMADAFASYYEHPAAMAPLSPSLRKTADTSVEHVRKALHLVVKRTKPVTAG